VLANYSVSDLLQKPQQRLAKRAVAFPRFAEHVADQMGWNLKGPS
jgi:hypothetical protein